MASKSSPPPPLTPEEFSGMLAAHRQWGRFGGKEGQKADLSGANLAGLDLDAYDLSGLDFRGANLFRVKFGDAHVEGADFRGADLREADLRGARSLLAPQLAGADLAGARLPEDLQEFAGLKHVDAASGHVQRLFFILLLACVYCWLTIAVTTDANLLNNFSEQPLPIIGTKINLVMFYWAAPFLLLCVYLYFHLCLQRLWEALAGLPGVFPDGLPLPHRVHPWLWNGLVWAYSPRLRDRRPPLLGLQKILAILLVWWAGPLTILALWWRYLPAHDWTITILQLVFLTLALDGTLGFSLLTRATLRLEERRPSHGKRLWRPVYGLALLSATATFAVLFTFVSIAAIDGVGGLNNAHSFTVTGQEETKESLKPPQVAIKLLRRLNDLREAEVFLKPPQAFIEMLERLIYGRPFAIADLEEAEVSLKPSQWTGTKPEEIDLVRGAFLRGRDLRFVNAGWAFLIKADLENANLQEAKLRGSKLQKSVLRFANLQKASMRAANLKEASLDCANLQEAHLLLANFQEASLWSAKLQRAVLESASLQKANLSQANLQEAKLIDANLQEAYLDQANLEEALMGGANLQKANLMGANLQGAKGLTKEQIMAASCWVLAKYSKEMLEILKLPPEHNQNLNDANLSNYRMPRADLWGAHLQSFNLQGAILEGANLEQANMYEVDLKGANLRGANLKGADLRFAKGLTRKKLKSVKMDKNTKLPDDLKDLVPSGSPKP
jgi:uncharacterized protein YjbI with pentapeptide repeats